MSPKFKPRRQIIAELKKKQEEKEQRLEKTQELKQKTTNVIQKINEYIKQKWQIIKDKNFPDKTKLLLKNAAKGIKNYFLLGGKALQTIIALFFSLITGIWNFFYQGVTGLSIFIWQIRWVSMVLLILFFLAGNTYFENQRFSKHPQSNLLQTLNFYPTWPLTYTTISKQLYDLGYEQLAQTYFNRSQTSFRLINTIPFFTDNMEETKKYISAAKTQRDLLNKINQQLEKNPYLWQLWLLKAKTEAQLWQDKASHNSLDFAMWLYPLLPKRFQQLN
ncbi:hypothetical protein GYA49_06095 [Candidatus Beckwithbacteria bacterium]|nr:hypothetical protein [Candidatus Beckwithbacteria bacterium]